MPSTPTICACCANSIEMRVPIDPMWETIGIRPLTSSTVISTTRFLSSVVIEKNSADYQKYSEVSNAILTNNLFNTYDNYLKKKYKIDINYKALDYVNNYFKWK